jgi:hypothetical protein
MQGKRPEEHVLRNPLGRGRTGATGATSATEHDTANRDPRFDRETGRTRAVDEPRTRVAREHHDHDHGTGGGMDAGTMRAARARQREEFGGINWGAAFFGWLVAVGLGALLTGLLSAAGAALAIGEVSGSDADTIGIVGAIALVAVLLIAYFAGGYVAGRMSRFDGARQGFAAWAIGLVIALALAAAGAILGAEYNVLAQLNLPRIPVDEGDIAVGGIITLIAAILLPLLAAILGGKAGERYHKKVDRAAIDHR